MKQQEEKLRCPEAEGCNEQPLTGCIHKVEHKQQQGCEPLEEPCKRKGKLTCTPVEPEPKPEGEQGGCKIDNPIIDPSGKRKYTNEYLEDNMLELSKTAKQPEQEKCAKCKGKKEVMIGNIKQTFMMKTCPDCKGTGFKPIEKGVDLLEGMGSPSIGDQKPKEEPIDEKLFNNLRYILCDGTTDCENYPECPTEDYCLVEKIIKDVIPKLRQSIGIEYIGKVEKEKHRENITEKKRYYNYGLEKAIQILKGEIKS